MTPDLPKVTRFEVILPEGRLLIAYGVNVELSLQDSGRTLKVFLTDSTPTEHEHWIATGNPGAIDGIHVNEHVAERRRIARRRRPSWADEP